MRPCATVSSVFATPFDVYVTQVPRTFSRSVPFPNPICPLISSAITAKWRWINVNSCSKYSFEYSFDGGENGYSKGTFT